MFGLIRFCGSQEPSEINVWVQLRVRFSFILLQKNVLMCRFSWGDAKNLATCLLSSVPCHTCAYHWPTQIIWPVGRVTWDLGGVKGGRDTSRGKKNFDSATHNIFVPQKLQLIDWIGLGANFVKTGPKAHNRIVWFFSSYIKLFYVYFQSFDRET